MELRGLGKSLIVGLLFTSHTASALFLKNLNMELEPKKGVHYEEIINQTPGKKVYTISMVQVSLPKENSKETVISDGDLLYSPQKLVLNSQDKSGFKFYYKGSLDAKERYFRVKIIETPVGVDTLPTNRNALLYDYRVAVEAIMVVRPANENFNYQMSSGELINSGNAFFKYMSSKNCEKKYSHSKFIAPGEHLSLSDEMTVENRVILYKNKIITLSRCHL